MLDPYRFGAAGFSTPAGLFSDGSTGAFWDFTDASTLFSDTARTTLATVGGSVRGVTDKSGTGRHLNTNSTTILRQTNYLGFPTTVVDGFFTAASGAVGSVTGHTAIVSFMPSVILAGAATIGADYGGGVARISQTLRGIDSTLYSLTWPGQFSVQSATGSLVVDTNYYATMYFSPTDHVIRKNGVSVASRTFSTVTPANTSVGNISVGADFAGTGSPTSWKFAGRIYAVLFINRQLTLQELTDTEAWFAGLIGL